MTAAAIAQAQMMLRQRTASAEAKYEALITKLAAGGDEQPETVVVVAEAAGRTLDDLQSDIAKLEGLAAARKQLAELPTVLNRIAAIEQRRAELTAELNAVHKRVGAEQEQLAAELHAALNAKHRLDEVEQQIGIGKFDLPGQAAQRAEASRLVKTHGMAAHNLRTELEQARRKAKALADSLEGLRVSRQPNENDINIVSADLASTRVRIVAIERELRPLEQALARANAVFAELAGSAA